MATQTLVSVEEYLRTTYDHDREYVRGEVVERGMPTYWHGKLQTRFGVLFEPFSKTLDLHAVVEVRNKLREDLYRIPDVAVYLGEPSSAIPSEPPLIAIEIVSPDDRYSALVGKCEEYQTWGVKYIWIADPQTLKLSVYNDAGLHEVKVLSLPELNVTFSREQIFA